MTAFNPGPTSSERFGSRMAMASVNKFGKKKKAWDLALKHLEKEAVANGIFEWKEFTIDDKKYRKRMGICRDCGKYKHLTPDHLIKRSQLGDNKPDNIEWVCKLCHDLRDNKGDPMNKKPKKKNSATKSWKVSHPCKECGHWNVGLLCPKCGKISL